MNGISVCPKEVPFFVVGNPRSGTTLLTYILSSHPRLHIPGETGFLPQLTKYGQGSLSRGQVNEIIEIIEVQNRDWTGIVENRSGFYDRLPSKSLSCVLDRLYHLKIQAFEAERWGDKTPTYVRYIPQIRQIFPEAQYIHLIRDGRDSVLSAQEKWGKQRWYMDSYYLLKNWAINVQAGCQAGKILNKEQYLEIKYEDLVQRPYETIELVCSFLQEAFHPDMLEHTKLAEKVITPAGHTEVLRPINTQSVERWQAEMSLFDKKLANVLVGKILAQFDYPLLENGSLAVGEKARVLMLGVRYQIINVFRRGLYKTGLLRLNRGKRRN